MLKKRILIIQFIILLLFSSSFANGRNLTIFAEPNMVMALTKISRVYSRISNTVVSVNFNSLDDPIYNIDSGEPADVFITAHKGWIESLRQKGLIDIYNIGYIASDRLALATSSKNNNIPQELLQKKNYSMEYALQILDEKGASIIINHNESSSGNYSDNYLKELNLKNLKIYKKLVDDKTLFAELIKKNNENFAVTFKSDLNKIADLNILTLEEDELAFYQALVIAGDNMEIAREFLRFLKSDLAKKILKESGFLVS
jgi:molybdate transport system substrate-binding protein